MQALIADHNPTVCSALRLLLEQEFSHCIVTEVSTVEELLEGVAARHPDLVLLDWEFLKHRRRATVSALRLAHPGAVIVALNGPAEVELGHGPEAVDANLSTRQQPWRVLETLRALLESAPHD